MGCTSCVYFYFLLNLAINESNAAYGHELTFFLWRPILCDTSHVLDFHFFPSLRTVKNRGGSLGECFPGVCGGGAAAAGADNEIFTVKVVAQHTPLKKGYRFSVVTKKCFYFKQSTHDTLKPCSSPVVVGSTLVTKRWGREGGGGSSGAAFAGLRAREFWAS